MLAFARIDALELLAHIVRHILIPETVWHEVTRGPWRPGAEAIRHASWVEVHGSHNSTQILPLLDRGEAEVIALAEAIGATEVVLDERAARAVATARGLKIIGTAGLLVRAKQRGLIPAVRPWLERMQTRAYVTVSGL